MKNKKLIIIGAVILAIILVVSLFVGSYNDMVAKEGEVQSSFSQIEVQLQRRADLIPNFVNTVKGYSDYEQSTFTAVTEARAAVQKANTPADLSAAEAQLDGAISVWVNAVTEAYPDLKANTMYVALTDELAGTENRIARARSDYNTAATEYNVYIRRFPKNIFASLFGFEKAELFEAADGAEQVPNVSFE